MAKRKRNSEGEVDVGLGATLALLKEEAARANNAPASAGQADDESWTTVGAPKKRRTEKAPQDGPRESEMEPLEDGHLTTGPANLLAGFIDGSIVSSREDEIMVNPFSTKQQDGSDNKHEPLAASPPARDTRHSSEERRDAKAKRGKERKLERKYPAIVHSNHNLLKGAIKVTDLQALALYILADGTAPTWVSVQNRSSIEKVVVLMVPGLEQGMFNGNISLTADAPQNGDTDEARHRLTRLNMSPDDYYPVKLQSDRLPDALKPLSDIFPHVWPTLGVGDHRAGQFFRLHSPIHTMLSSQIPRTREDKQKKKNHKGPLPQRADRWQNKRTRITEYIATLVEQLENDYAVHSAWYTTPEAKEAAREVRKAAGKTSDDGWVESNVASLEEGDIPEEEIQEGSVTAGRQIYAVDCEFCRSENNEALLTRFSLVDWDGKVIFDDLVKPDIPITNYLTQYSGITKEMLEDVTTTLSDIQQKLLKVLTPRSILLGHSLNSDLDALKFTHPFLVDTSLLYPHVRGPPYKQGLKYLCTKYLSKEIQKGTQGHDSREDARACLDLVKQKCDRGPEWGTSANNFEPIFKRLARVARPKASKSTRAGAVVDWGEPSRGQGSQAQVAIPCKSDEDVIKGIEDAIKGQALGKDGATQEVDFVWGRLRELELLRGWWDHAESADVEVTRREALQRLGCPFNEKGETEAVKGAELEKAVAQTVGHIVKIHESLPPGTAFIVYSGTGDPREMRRLQRMQKIHQEEFKTKKWDDCSVQWTDTEVQALSRAVRAAREGISFVKAK